MTRIRLPYNNGLLSIEATSCGLTISGEIEKSTRPVLAEVLEDFASDHTDLHLDLAALSYCDVTGLWAMVQFAVPDGDGRSAKLVVLHAIPPYMKTMLRILGWHDELPGLSVTDVPR